MKWNWNNMAAVALAKVTQGPMHGDLLLAYVRAFLGPILSAGDLAICDGLSSHHVTDVREAIEAWLAIFKPLPLYSPHLNPIEQVFSRMKAGLRHAAARRVETFYEALAEVLEYITPTERANYLRGAGYAIQAK
jgi:transposase